MVKVKVCGLTLLEDAVFAVEQGADALGTILEPSSPRFFEGDPLAFSSELPLTPLVAVFGPWRDGVDLGAYTHVQAFEWPQGRAVEGLGFDGASGQGQPGWIKALPVAPGDTLEDLVERAADHGLVMLDKASPKHGGTGEAIDWQLAADFVAASPGTRVILAGGLSPDNVRQAVQTVRPYAVDASSKLEKAPGVKDPELVKRFIQEAKSA